MADMDEPDEGFGLVMPFVIVASAGGSLDDLAFACGWDCGALNAELELCARLGATPQPRMMKREILVQTDLIAMHHGFLQQIQPDDEGQEWHLVSFTPADPHARPGDDG